MSRTGRILIVLAAIMGADGVMLAAASAHGADASRLASASSMLLFHASAVLGAVALAERGIVHGENRHRGRFRLRHCGKPVRRRPDAAALCRAWPVSDGRADRRDAADRELAGAGGRGGLAEAGVSLPSLRVQRATLLRIRDRLPHPAQQRIAKALRASREHEPANPPLCALPANRIEPGPTSGMARPAS